MVIASQPIGDQIEEFKKRVRGEEAWCVMQCSVLIIVPGIWPVTFVFESYIPRESWRYGTEMVILVE